jgi:hypothetical protein
MVVPEADFDTDHDIEYDQAPAADNANMDGGSEHDYDSDEIEGGESDPSRASE